MTESTTVRYKQRTNNVQKQVDHLRVINSGQNNVTNEQTVEGSIMMTANLIFTCNQSYNKDLCVILIQKRNETLA